MNSIHRILAVVLIHIAMAFERWSFWHNDKVKCECVQTYLNHWDDDVQLVADSQLMRAVHEHIKNKSTIH